MLLEQISCNVGEILIAAKIEELISFLMDIQDLDDIINTKPNAIINERAVEVNNTNCNDTYKSSDT